MRPHAGALPVLASAAALPALGVWLEIGASRALATTRLRRSLHWGRLPRGAEDGSRALALVRVFCGPESLREYVQY